MSRVQTEADGRFYGTQFTNRQDQPCLLYTSIQRTLIGSTTDYVVNHALCNVLVVR